MSNTFNFFPLAPFPTPAAGFPTGVQFQIDSTNLGSPNPTNVNFSGLSISGSYDELTDTVNFNVSESTSGGGSGATPGSPDGAVQFNSAGVFGGNVGFTFVPASAKVTLGHSSTSAGNINGFDFSGNGHAGDLTITGGTASGDGGIGGTILLQGGHQTFGGSVTVSTSAGDVQLFGGNNSTNNAGAVTLEGGTATGFTGGPVTVTGGTGAAGGDVNVTGGHGTAGNGGSVTISSGGSDTNAAGDLTLNGADGNLSGGTVFLNGGNAGCGIEVQGRGNLNPGVLRLFGYASSSGSVLNGGDVLIKGGNKDGSNPSTTSDGYLNITLLAAVPTIAPTDWSGSGYAPFALVNTGSVYKLVAYLNGAWRSVALT